MAAAVALSHKNSGGQKKASMDEFRAKPTEANPKHTLFGSALEMHDKTETEDIRRLDVQTIDEENESVRLARQNRYRAMLPDNVKQKLPASEKVEQSRNALAKQLQQTLSARNAINTLEERSKFFEVGIHGKPEEPKKCAPNSKQCMTLQDIWHADDVNILGLGEGHKNYDYQKHRQRKPFHLNNLEDPGSTSAPGRVGRYQYKRHRAPDWLPPEAFMNSNKPEPVITTVDLPPNIQHQFGTKICKDVLSDAGEVSRTLDFQKQRRAGRIRLRSSMKVEGKQEDDFENPQYTSLGHALRYNICPGYSDSVKTSHAKSVYTKEVHKRRFADPEQYRYQRDSLSQWAEFNILYSRMQKQWDEYLQSQPKALPNWDRDAKRTLPIPIRKPVEKPKKVKPKSKKETGPPIFEEVVFKTPPLTPPPQADIVRKPSYTRDDEFWSFYDQETT